MRALGPSPSAAKLLVPQFGLDSASPTASQAPQRARPRRWWPRGPGGRARAAGSGARNGASARDCTFFLRRGPLGRRRRPLSLEACTRASATASCRGRHRRPRASRGGGAAVVQQAWRPLSLELRHAGPSTSPRWSPLAAAGHPRRPCPPPASLCPRGGRPWLPRRCCCCSSSPRRRRPCSGSSWPRRGGASRGLPHHLQRRPAGGGVEAARRSSPRQLVRGAGKGKVDPGAGGVADVR